MAKVDDIDDKRKLAEFRTRLRRKIAETEDDLESLRILLKFVDETLIEKSFKKAEALRQKPQKPTVPPPIDAAEATPLKTQAGETLANLSLSEDTMYVIIPEDKTFSTQTPPFKQFLIERVLEKMKEKDSEAVRGGEISPDQIFSYELIVEDDKIREIQIKNFTPERLRELKSSIRWTLEKMYEKTTNSNSIPA